MGAEPKHKNLSAVCIEIGQYFDNNETDKNKLAQLAVELHVALGHFCSVSNFNKFCKLLTHLAKFDNPLAQQIETECWQMIFNLPLLLELETATEATLKEPLLAGKTYPDLEKSKHSSLLQLVEHVIANDKEKFKRVEARRVHALNIYLRLAIAYEVSGSKQIFLEALLSKILPEETVGMFGMEHYYNQTLEPVDHRLIEYFDRVFAHTNDRNAAYACLQLRVKAGLLDKPNAILRLADWNKKHH